MGKKKKTFFLSSTRIPTLHCVTCEAVLDGATGLDTTHPTQPKPGDVTACLYCGTWMVFGAAPDLTLSLASAEVMAGADPELRAIAEQTRRQWRATHHRRSN